MWPRTFADRLESWSNLRRQCLVLEPELALQTINAWWFDTPWTPYHLHWDERNSWPDPWQLLDDNIYCGLARGLGIMYTIVLLDRADMQDAEMIEMGSDNLVLFDQGKYILNWDRDQIVNINLSSKKTQHCISQQQIKIEIK
jgi:hypothetical protein